MTTKELADLFNSQANTVNILWTLLCTIALAVLAYVCKGGRNAADQWTKSAITAGFVLFAIGNCTAMYRSQRILEATASALRDRARALAVDHAEARLAAAHITPSPVAVLFFQIALIAAVVLLIWGPSLFDLLPKRAKSRTAQASAAADPIAKPGSEPIARKAGNDPASRKPHHDPMAGHPGGDPTLPGRREDGLRKRPADELADSSDDWPKEPRRPSFEAKGMHIAKGPGSETGPIRIPTYKNKLLQRATAWVWAGVIALVLCAVGEALWLGRRDHAKPPPSTADTTPPAPPMTLSKTTAPVVSAATGKSAPSKKPTEQTATKEGKRQELATNQRKVAVPPRKESVASLPRQAPKTAEVDRGPPPLYRPAVAIDVAALRRRMEAPWAAAATTAASGRTVRVGRGAAAAGGIYPSLEKACAAAAGPLVIEIHDNGPLFESPLAVRGRSLVVRGGREYRPLLAWNLDAAAKAPAWLSVANGDLTLENVDVVIKYPQTGAPDASALVEVRDGSFTARDCTFSVVGRPRSPVAAVRLLTSRASRRQCRLEHCYLRGADMSALDLRGPADVLLEGCLAIGADPPLLDVAAGSGAAATSIAVVRSTLVANQAIVHLQSTARTDAEPALRWFGWDSLLSHPDEPGGQMLEVDTDTTGGIDWQAVNCLYAGWKTLLTSRPEVISDGRAWLERWHRREGDIARAGAWPALAPLDPSEIPAKEYRTENAPIFFPATSGNGGLGCDVGRLPPTRNAWQLLTYDRMPAPSFVLPPPLGEDEISSEGPVERVDLAKIDDLGDFVESLRRQRKLGPRLVLRVIGDGENFSRAIRLTATDLTLYLENRTKNAAPLVLVPSGGVAAGRAFVDIENGNLRIVGGAIRYPGPQVNRPPAYLVRVRDGQFVLAGTRLSGPMASPPAAYRALVRLESSQASGDGFSRIWGLSNSVLASAGDCVELGGCDADLCVRNCAIVAAGAALHLHSGTCLAGQANIRCFLERSTLACKQAVLRLDDAPPKPLPDPIVIESHASAFVAPFADARAGLLRYEEDALRRGLLIWQGDGDAFDKRLSFAALPVKAEATPQAHQLWTELWGSAGDRGPILDAPFSSKTMELPKEGDKLPLEMLALLGRGRSKPTAGADIPGLSTRRTKRSR